MADHTHTTAAASAADTFAIDQREAERLSGVSYKTLERLSRAGEPCGRIRVGRRVLFVRAQLEAWILAQLPAAHS